MVDSRPEEKDPDRLIKWGKVITVVWLFGMLAGFAGFGRLDELNQPDKLGSFLQCLFAPLAFGWLVIAVLLQTRELGLQRRELELNRQALVMQADELRKSVEQFSAQTELLREQSESDAINQLEESLNRRIDKVARRMVNSIADIVFYSDQLTDPVDYLSGKTKKDHVEPLRHLVSSGQIDEFYSLVLRRVVGFNQNSAKIGSARRAGLVVVLNELILEFDEIGNKAILNNLHGVLNIFAWIGIPELRSELSKCRKAIA